MTLPTEYVNQEHLVSVVSNHALVRGDKIAYTFLGRSGEIAGTLSYRELDQRARRIAAYLPANAGDRIILDFPSGLDFVSAFWGCLYAGVIAVPIFPARSAGEWTRLDKILQDCQARIIFTHARRKAAWASRMTNPQSSIACITIEDIPEHSDSQWQSPTITPHTLAFLQYTSGTTERPKGVMVSHANLFHNETLIKNQFGHHTDTVIVSWLPHYHDMGLIGKIVQAPFLGGQLIFMEPLSFLSKPIRWLEALSRFQGHSSAAPNFAYQHCIERIEEKDLATIDLSHWQNACNGSEIVRMTTLEQFYQKFARCGFQKRAFMPCYGMAEATLLVCSLEKSEEPKACRVKQSALERNEVLLSHDDNESVQLVVNHGRHTAQDIRIVNPDTLLACERFSVGEIWIKGPSVCQGYWNNSQATREHFHAYLATGSGPFLRTGDLGFMNEQGALFITGRVKDMIIVRGHNYYPQDIEAALQRLDRGLRIGFGAAFAIEQDNGEQVVVVQEVDKRSILHLDIDEVLGRAKKSLTSELAVEIGAIGLVRQGALPVTSSGKVQRRLCRDKFLQGTFTFLGSLN